MPLITAAVQRRSVSQSDMEDGKTGGVKERLARLWWKCITADVSRFYDVVKSEGRRDGRRHTQVLCHFVNDI